MTVKELMDELTMYPEDMTVCVDDNYYGPEVLADVRIDKAASPAVPFVLLSSRETP